jgi:hypothetical protein
VKGDGAMKAVIVARVALVGTLVAQPRPASAVVRLLAQSDAPGEKPVLGNGQDVLFIRRSNVVIGCPTPPDGPPAPDADPDAPDAGPPDAAPPDAGPPDAGPSPDAGPTPDAGDCGDNPVSAVTMVVQPRFSITTTGARFAVLLVTPSDPLVEVEDPWLFAQLTDLTATQVEYEKVEVEDPALGERCFDSGSGCGALDLDSDPYWDPPDIDPDQTQPIVTVGPYEVARSTPATTDELRAWLDGLGYLYLPEDIDAVAPYLPVGHTVLAVRVISEDAFNGGLEPLALTWAGNQMRVPIGLGAGEGPRSITVYIAAEGRYDLPNADVSYASYTNWSSDASFLTRNELVIDESTPVVSDPIAERILGDPTYIDTIVIPMMVRVPVTDCGDWSIGCCDLRGRTAPTPTFFLVAFTILAITRRRPRRRSR